MSGQTNYDLENSLGMLLDWATQFMRLELNRKFKAAGLQATSEQWKILIILWLEDGLTQQQLAGKTHKNKVSVVKLIDGLERRGLVNRCPEPKDRRSNRIFLMPKGKTIQAKMIKLAQQNLDQAATGIDAAEVTTCKKVLKQIISNMKDNLNDNG